MTKNSTSMGSMTTRMLYILGELKRQMNGAVVGSMRYYGAEYGLNYGVSIATIRALGREQVCDHTFAKYLYEQHVRELRLISLWLADPLSITSPEETESWARGIVNSEVAEEAAFVLFSKVDGVVEWLRSDDELLQYCALISLSWRDDVPLGDIRPRLVEIMAANPKLSHKGVIALLDRALRLGAKKEVVEFLDSLPQNEACDNTRDEIAWRI